MQVGRGGIESLGVERLDTARFRTRKKIAPIQKEFKWQDNQAAMLVLCLVSQAQAETLLGKVIHVQDGDSITVLDDTRTQHGLPFEVVQREFAGREEAMDWIDANQLGRRNLPPEERTRLIGRRYNRAKRQGARTDLTSGQSGTKLQTAERIAAEHGVSPRTVKRAGQYDEAATVIEQAGGTVAGADQQAVAKALVLAY